MGSTQPLPATMGRASRTLPRRLRLLSPGGVALPVAGHDVADRIDLIDDFGEAEFGDLAAHRSRVLVGAGQLGNVGDAAEIADVDSRRLLGDQVGLALAGVLFDVGRAAEVPS